MAYSEDTKVKADKAYWQHMRAHVDEGGMLGHRNGADLLTELERVQAINVDLLEAAEKFIADMQDLLQSRDHLKMALHLAESGTPLAFDDGGPDTVKKIRAVIARARGQQEGEG